MRSVGTQSAVSPELNDLSNKPTHTPQEKRRFAFLQTACAAIRSGVAVEEVEDLYREDAAKRGGVKLPAKTAENPEARALSEYASNPEKCDVEGDPLARIGTFTGLGYLVPNAWRDEVVFAQKQHDALSDDDAVTMIRSTNAA